MGTREEFTVFNGSLWQWNCNIQATVPCTIELKVIVFQRHKARGCKLGFYPAHTGNQCGVHSQWNFGHGVQRFGVFIYGVVAFSTFNRLFTIGCALHCLTSDIYHGIYRGSTLKRVLEIAVSRNGTGVISQAGIHHIDTRLIVITIVCRWVKAPTVFVALVESLREQATYFDIVDVIAVHVFAQIELEAFQIISAHTAFKEQVIKGEIT